MTRFSETIHVDLLLGAYGDAFIHGYYDDRKPAPGLALKQALFAWHEDSFYGTELHVHVVEGTELVVLPSEMVVPFFGELKVLKHLEWKWAGKADRLVRLAPKLLSDIDDKTYFPSHAAHLEGKLLWAWDEDGLSEEEKAALDFPEGDDTEFADGLKAAFSAAVFHRHYGTEATAGDLRREFPLLFAKNVAAELSGQNEKEWLTAIGWKADEAPFRPALQLLEPDEETGEWQLRLVLQDKRDPSAVTPIRLSALGEAFGAWPAAWTPFVRARSSRWAERLRASLPDRVPGDRLRRELLSEPLDGDAAWAFLARDSDRLLEAGWQVLLPAWWEAASRKSPKLRAKVSGGEGGRSGSSLFGLDSIIEFDWRVAIGELDLTESEFAELVARNARLVRFKGEWIPLDPALIAQIRRAMSAVDKQRGLTFQDVLQLHLLGEGDGGNADPDARAAEADPAAEARRVRMEVELSEHLVRLIGQLNQQADLPKLDAPESLRADLRAYQRDGYSWLSFLRRFGLGACLADDMGLGKTVQLIAYLLRIQETSGTEPAAPSLIVCPTSVLGNWQKELSRFAPSLKVLLHYGARRSSGLDFVAETMGADVVLTSYSTCTLDQETLQGVVWTSVSLDEAQNIKNAQTKQSVAVRSLEARHRIALTGTPIENRLSELWSLYDFINPGYLGTAKAFNERFAASVERERDAERTADLQKLIKPFLLRRKKKDPSIQLDLPDKNEMKTYVPLTAEQGALYEQTVNALMEKMQKLEGIERKGAILAALTALKQLCDHPILLTKEALPQLASVHVQDGEADGPPLDTDALVARSSKLERLLAMVKELRDEGDRCLIFTQYIGMGEMLKQVLSQELQEPVQYLNGSTSKSARDRMIDKFQATGDFAEDPDAPDRPGVFILSLKAGGVGLNLTAANHVFHFDRWWNPAVENQATDRAYRMGQTRDVQVHKFISLGTLEERIDEMLESKLQLSDNVIASSEGWITELSTDALKDLFALRRDMIG